MKNYKYIFLAVAAVGLLCFGVPIDTVLDFIKGVM